MRTLIRFPALAVAVAVALGSWWLRATEATAAVAIRSNVEVSGATAEQLAMSRWAVQRFEDAGLDPPAVEIAFHLDAAGCADHLGFAKGGNVDVCTTLVNAMARRVLLHEMSHIWLDQNVNESTRARFLQARALPSWNASADEWRLRGYEQGAEIMAWVLGDGILTAQISDNDPAELALGFELLTGSPEPGSSAPNTGAPSTHTGVIPVSSRGGE
jgi:hypothetical protein